MPKAARIIVMYMYIKIINITDSLLLHIYIECVVQINELQFTYK